MRPGAFALLALLAAALGNPVHAPAAEATAEEVRALREELRALRERLEELAPLEERVRELEAALAEREVARPEPPPAPPGDGEARDLVPAKPGAPDGPPAEEALRLDVGGALRFNYAYREFTESSESKWGDLEFDIFRIDVDAQYKGLLASAQYRWYDFQDVIHHGWVGLEPRDDLQIRGGITQVPFGLLPYASHNWWFGVPYYLGFEDDYDMGAEVLYRPGSWDLRLAFFKNAEYGNPSRTERYSFDLVTDASRGQANEETNQVNLRVARSFRHGPDARTEVGVSGEWGQIYNDLTDDLGTRWAAGAHVDGDYGPWNLQLEAFRYVFAPENPPGVSDDALLLGAFASTFLAPAEGVVMVANLSRDLPLELGPIDGVTCYNDYSVLLPDGSSRDDVQINTTGCLVSAGPVATYLDVILGSGAPFLGVPPEEVFRPIAGDDWELRLNLNVGYYF